MTVVSAEHVALVRCRKSLQKAFDRQDWESVRLWDRRLGECLNSAFDNDSRDTDALVDELQKVLALYANIVAAVPVEAKSMVMSGFSCVPLIPVKD